MSSNENNQREPWEELAELVSGQLSHHGEHEIVTKKHENTPEGEELFRLFREKLGWDNGDSNA